MVKAKVNGVECKVYDYKWVNGRYVLTVSFPNCYNIKFDVLAELVEMSEA